MRHPLSRLTSFLLAIFNLAGLVISAAATENLVPLVLTLPKPYDPYQAVREDPNYSDPKYITQHPREDFLAPRGVVNLALSKPVTSSDNEPVLGELPMLTNGKKNDWDNNLVELGADKQWVQIDLQTTHPLYAVVLWHSNRYRTYHAVVVQLSDDPNFITGVQTIFNNDDHNLNGLGIGTDPTYLETHQGRLIDAKGIKARFVRCYSNGRYSDRMNHYLQVEVYGTP